MEGFKQKKKQTNKKNNMDCSEYASYISQSNWCFLYRNKTAEKISMFCSGVSFSLPANINTFVST